MGQVKKILVLCEDENLKDVISFCLEGWGYEVILSHENTPGINYIKKEEADLVIADFTAGSINKNLKLCRDLKEDYITKSLPVVVLINKRQLRKHLLDLKHGIDDYLFKPPDPLDLRIRVEMALRRTQHSFYTNSLTKLEGGKIIEDMLKEKLRNNEKFAFSYVDIDNFKTFNDRYGYIKGDKVITQTAYILYNTVKVYGNKTKDFIGHIGGDDFVFMTSPEKERKIAVELITQFDRLVPLHYSEDDRKRNSIKVKDRLGKIWQAPLMSLSVAIVNNEQRDFSRPAEVNEVIAGLKSYLKKQPGSNFMVERRQHNRGINNRQSPNVERSSHEKDEQQAHIPPLGQLLISEANLSKNDLEQALEVHWRRGIPLGEVLQDLHLVSSRQIDKMLKYQKEIKTAFAG